MSSPSDPKANLQEYRRKRDFNRTPEPSGDKSADPGNLFVVQKHASSHLHYDFRLRLHGALKSWALPKGPSLDPDQHRLANHVEDHPLAYADFEGVIPKGEYGAGTVMLWDRGEWEPLDEGKQGYYRGRLHFNLHGTRLRGSWTLTRDEDSKKWTLSKDPDQFSAKDKTLEDTSVASGRTMEEIASAGQRFWTGKEGLVVEDAVLTLGHRLGGALPDFIVPQSATLVDRVPEDDGWIHEMKYDGYRILCRIDKSGGGIRFYTRKGVDFTDRLGALREAAAALPVTQAWLDGEIVVLTESGKSDFHALQNAFIKGSPANLSYFVFDLMNYEGYDIRSIPLVERKSILADLIWEAKTEQIRFVDDIAGQGKEFYQAACREQLEGVVSKRADSEYGSRRSQHWLKVKCSRRQEFVVGGYTESGAGRLFGSLLAGYYDDQGKLIFAGKIKTGYSKSVSSTLIETMRRYEQPDPPFINPPSGHQYRNPHWLRPELVAEVDYAEITGTGLLRHASFKGLREDKEAGEVTLEVPERVPERKSAQAAKSAKPAVFPQERIGRDGILDYYTLVADRMLPYISDRPLTLIVCPTNIYACKFTKHATHLPPPIKAIQAGHEERYLAIDSLEGLQTLVRLGTVELHGWQSRYTDLERPDRMLFDLDPPQEEPLPWERIAEAALLLRIHLQEHGLESYLQTSGGKGYYLVVPLVPTASWRTATPFAKQVAQTMEAKYPDRFTAKLAKKERGGRIYLDWMRNSRGAHAAEPYSLRARPGATIATPITWEELVAGVRPDTFHLRNIRERLDQLKGDPWQGYFELTQQLPQGTGSAGACPPLPR